MHSVKKPLTLLQNSNTWSSSSWCHFSRGNVSICLQH